MELRSKNIFLRALSLLLFVNLIFFTAAGQISKLNTDTLSLNEVANREIKKKVLSISPVITSYFYSDGKRVTKGYKVYFIVNGIMAKHTNHQALILDTSKFKYGDSVCFLLKYKTQKIYSEKFSYKRFLHGGTFITGIISNYVKEREKFSRDSNIYFSMNQANKLYDVIIRAGKIDKEYLVGNQKLYYAILKSNTELGVSYKFKFSF